MNRQISAMLAFAGAGLLVAAAATAGQAKPAPAGQAKPATPPATQPAAPAGQAGEPAGSGLAFVARDERTGETYLKLPVPKPEVLEQALKAFGALLENFRR